MGIGQISISQFPAAFPMGYQSDLDMNVGALKGYTDTVQEIQKQRYENQLLKFLLGLGQPPEGQGGESGQPSLQGLLAAQPMPQDAARLGQPPGLGMAQPSFMGDVMPPAGMPAPIAPGMQGQSFQPQLPLPQAMMPPTIPTPPPQGLASLAAPGGMPIPDIMRQRFEQPTREPGLMGLLKGVGGAFNPMGQYRGAPTQLESLILGERMKQMIPEKMTPYQRESLGIEREKMAREQKGFAPKGFSFHDGLILNEDTGKTEEVVGYNKSQTDPSYTKVTIADGTVYMVNSKDPSDVQETGLKEAVSEAATKEYDNELEATSAANAYIKKGWRAVVVPTPSGKFKLDTATPIAAKASVNATFKSFAEAQQYIADNQPGMMSYYPVQNANGTWKINPPFVAQYGVSGISIGGPPPGAGQPPVAKPILKDKYTIGQTATKNGVTYKYIGNNQWQKI